MAAMVAGGLDCFDVGGQNTRNLAGEDVAAALQLACGGDVVERRLRDAEVPGEEISWGMREPVGYQECLVLREVAVVEDQQEFAIFEHLNGMRKAGPEVPQVATPDVVDEVASALVDGGDAGTAREHESPFSLAVFHGDEVELDRIGHHFP